MAISLGELLFKIGLKGGKDTAGEIKNISAGIDKLVMGFARSKTAAIGLISQLDDMTRWAGQAGMKLESFSLSTGLSADELQRWQVMGENFGVTGDEMQSTIEGIQQKMTSMRMGEGMPKGMEILGITDSNDVFKILGQLEKASKGSAPAFRQNLMESFGISKQFFAFLRQNKLKPSDVPGHLLIDDKATKRLREMEQSWARQKLEARRMGIELVYNGIELFDVAETMKNVTEILSKGVQLTRDMSGGSEELKTTLVMVAGAVMAAFSPLLGSLMIITATLSKMKELYDLVKSETNQEANLTPSEKSFRRNAGIAEYMNSVLPGGVKNLDDKYFEEARKRQDAISGQKMIMGQVSGSRLPQVAGQKQFSMVNNIEVKSTDPRQAAKEIKDEILGAYSQLQYEGNM